MNSWQRWIKAPKTHWLHRTLFQIHLWMGIGLGLYIFLISVSGSAVVLRPQFTQWFISSRVIPTEEGPLVEEVLEIRVAQVYAEYEVLSVASSPFRSRALQVSLMQNDQESSRFFNQYTGEDLGTTNPWQVATVEWLVRFHDELLLGQKGRTINGIGGAFLLLMVLSGIIIWWQGRSRWRDGLQVKRQSKRSLNWQLHSFFGFWSLLLMFAWGITSVYFAFPEPFNDFIDFIDSDMEDYERPDAWLLFLIEIHFGRFGGLWGRGLWVVLGLLPAVMFVTGFILWWKRVVKRRWL